MTTNTTPSQPVDGEEVPEPDPRDDGCLCQRCGTRYKVDVMVSDELWEQIHGKENLLCGNCIVSAIEKLGRFDWYHLTYGDRATQPATGLGDERFIVNEPTSTVHCNDSRCRVGSTMVGWPHSFDTPECIYAATVATPTNVAEKARRAVEQLRERGLLRTGLNTEWIDSVDTIAETVIDIIVAEFTGKGEE